MRATCLGYAKLVSTPWHFKLDDSSSPSRNIEGRLSALYLHPDCLLLVLGCTSKYIDLSMYISGGFAEGLMVKDC